MNDTDILFFITCISVGVGIIHYAVKNCYRSKCSNVNICWGCVEIDRSIADEIQDHENDLEHNPRSSDETSQPSPTLLNQETYGFPNPSLLVMKP